MTDNLKADMQNLADHYSALVREHGADAKSAQYADRATQERRIDILRQIGVEKTSKVLDFGCGTGQMLSFLQRAIGYEGEYVGYDIAPDAIDLARQTHDRGRFELRDILTNPGEERFDFVLVSGVFNNLISDNRAFFKAASKALMAKAARGFAFNMLSRHVDYFDEGLYYEDPAFAFGFCKEALSPLVTLRHDYLVKQGAPPFEFTIYVHTSEAAPIALQDPQG